VEQVCVVPVDTHEPLLHCSMVHTFPSLLHEVPLGWLVGAGHSPVTVLHEPAIWQVGAVHVVVVPVKVHVPDWHVSMVQALPSALHEVPFALLVLHVPAVQVAELWH
jgi:hypothetical protein